MQKDLRVGLTGDFLRLDGTVGFGDIGLGMLDEAPGVEWEFMPGDGWEELSAEQVRPYDAVIVLGPRVSAATLEEAERLALMKESAFLINAARGPIVDQAALTEALRERRIAGAALDYLRIVDRFLEACRRHGKASGIMATGVDDARAQLERGFRCLAYWGDLWLYAQALRQGLAAIRGES